MTIESSSLLSNNTDKFETFFSLKNKFNYRFKINLNNDNLADYMINYTKKLKS